MKRVLFLVLMIFLARLASASTIRITAEDAGSSRLRIGYEITSGAELPVGFGINISLSGPATFQDVISASSYYPVYPGSMYINLGGDIIIYGTPIAPANYRGTLGGLGTSGVTVEMGIHFNPLVVMPPPFDPRDFNADGLLNNQDLAVFVSDWLAALWPEVVPLLPADLNGDRVVNFKDYGIFVDGRYDAPPQVINELILLQLDGNGAATTTVTISENLIRGGIVSDDGMPFDVILPEPFTVVVPEPGTVLLLGLSGLVLLRKRRVTVN